jgi:hypothetical protein
MPFIKGNADRRLAFGGKYGGARNNKSEQHR